MSRIKDKLSLADVVIEKSAYSHRTASRQEIDTGSNY